MVRMAGRDDPLNEVLHAAWEQLQRLDADLIPHRLDKVADHTGKRLTPPLAKLLLDELEKNEWLRSTLAAHLSTDASETLRAFLERSPGWWQEMIPQRGEATRDRDGKLEKQVERIRGERDEAKRRVKELRRQNEELAVVIREERRRKSLDPDTAASEEVEGLRLRVRELEAESAKLRREAARLEERIDDLRRRRRERLVESEAAARSAERGFGRTSAAALGRRLDLEFAALANTAAAADVGDEGETIPVPGEPASLRVPEGIAPDGGDAVDWVLSQPQAVSVIVDGYNLTFLLDPADFKTGTARRALVGRLAGLRRRLPDNSTVEVVFDSADGIDTDPFTTPAGVVVRYTATGVIADDDIVAAVAGSSLPAIVISNDRELRLRSEEAGGLPLWGDALVRWLER